MNTIITLLMQGLMRSALIATLITPALCMLTGAPAIAMFPMAMTLSLLAVAPKGALGAMSSADLTAFANEFGAFYQPRGQNAARLRQLLMQDSTAFDQQFTTMPLEGDVFEFALMAHSRVLQAWKPVWSPTGQLGGDPRKKTLRRVKVNVENIPDHLVNTWLGFLTTEGGKDPKIDRASWPFVRWYVEKYLIPQAKEDQYYEAFYGVYADPGTNSTAGAHGTSLDGILVERNRDIDAGHTTPIVTGPLESDPEAFVEQIEAFGEAFDSRYRGKELVINMDDLYAQRFKTGLIEANLLSPNEIKGTDLLSLPKRTNIKVLGHHNWKLGEGGAASEMLLCAPKGELVKGIRTSNKDGAAPRLEQVDYKLKMFNDWHVMYFVMDTRVCFTNDRDLSFGL